MASVEAISLAGIEVRNRIEALPPRMAKGTILPGDLSPKLKSIKPNYLSSVAFAS